MADRDSKFQYKGETVMMLGIFNPWTKEDTEVFKRAMTKTGQVSICIREVPHREDMGWVYGPGEITEQIRQALEPIGFYIDKHYVVAAVPNVVEMFSGPSKDYKDDQTLLDTPPPDSAFKTADFSKDPFEQQCEGSITFNPDMKHEDWPEG
jgi:hypothetical protein